MKLLGHTVLLTNFRPMPVKGKKLIVTPDNAHVLAGPVLADVSEIGTGVRYGELHREDTVIVPSQFGTKLIIDGKEFRIFNYEDILGIHK